MWMYEKDLAPFLLLIKIWPFFLMERGTQFIKCTSLTIVLEYFHLVNFCSTLNKLIQENRFLQQKSASAAALCSC